MDATDGDVGFFKAGTGWAPDSQGNDFASRFNEALAVWKNGTDYDPWTTSVTSNLVWVDGRRNTADTIPWEPGYLAVTTRLFVTRATYFDLYDTDIFLNTEDELWWRQPGAPSVGCGALGCYSARGVFTHELAHTIRLIDLSGSNCPPGPTMCGEALSTGDSDRLYTLTSDDIDGANAVY